MIIDKVGNITKEIERDTTTDIVKENEGRDTIIAKENLNEERDTTTTSKENLTTTDGGIDFDLQGQLALAKNFIFYFYFLLMVIIIYVEGNNNAQNLKNKTKGILTINKSNILPFAIFTIY